MIKFLIQRPIAVLMAFTACFIIGLVTYSTLPISLLPNIAIPEITVQVASANTSARELENTIVKPLRGQLIQVSTLKDIHSESRDGAGIIRLSFEYGTNTDLAFIEVNEKIDAAMNYLPKEAERPKVIKASATDIPVFYLNLTLKNDSAYGATEQHSFLELCEFAESVIKRRIEQLEEVAMVDVTGILERQVQIVPDKDKLAMWITPGSRHLGAFFDEYCQRGEDMPISISIGLDPAVYMCCGFEAPTTPLGFNELQIAGALRGHAVELADCVTVPQKCIANAEYVLEGYLMHDETINEDVNGHGYAMPEFPGYTGGAKVCPVIKITAVTTRVNPIMESCIGPSHEHVSMAGIPTEASIYKMVETAIPGRLLNVHAAPCGGGKFVAIMQFKKSSKNDEGRQRNAAMLAFSAFSELKHVILVDEDVDIFDMSDVMWAMTTRFQADVDLITIPGCHCHVLDPSNDPAFDPTIREHGIACKAIFDCTVPFDLKKNFIRSQFMEIDTDKWAKEIAF